jgi:hypothetical protein
LVNLARWHVLSLVAGISRFVCVLRARALLRERSTLCFQKPLAQRFKALALRADEFPAQCGVLVWHRLFSVRTALKGSTGASLRSSLRAVVV